MGDITATVRAAFTLEQLRRKRGRYEEVNGTICKWCTNHHSFLPVEAFDYVNSLGRHTALCRVCEDKQTAYMASPDGQEETAYWKRVSQRRKAKLTAGHVPKPRKHSCHQLVNGELRKTCTTCERLLPLDAFKKHGKHLRSQCKKCTAPKETAYRRAKTAKRQAERVARYDPIAEGVKRALTHKRQLERRRQRNATPEGKAKRRMAIERYRSKANVTAKTRHRKRMETDIEYRLKTRLKSRLASYFSARGTRKQCRSTTLLGCTIVRLRSHLESLWVPGMSWANYGLYKVGGPMTWHIDHIRPVASFDLLDSTQQRACFHWTNLQPLWAIDNIVKSDRLDWANPNTAYV